MYIAVMKAGAQPDLSLGDLVAEVQQTLRRLGIEDRGPDGRVAAVPDARTVRYYTTLGLVDRPRIVDREARYRGRHVLQLAAIKRLQSTGARLADVQRRLYGRSDAELQALLDIGAAGRAVAPEPIVWREVSVAPGLKIVAQSDWTADGSEDDLIQRVRAALDVLSARQPRKGRQ
jgi:DNA-binding transcriptional MerR regulator